MWKYRVSFRNMINVTFVTGRRARERRGEGEGGGEGGREAREVRRQRTGTVGSCLCTCVFIALSAARHSENKALRIQADSLVLLVYAPHTDGRTLLWPSEYVRVILPNAARKRRS